MPALAPHRWQPGVSANPLGRAAEIAKRVEQKRFLNVLLEIVKETPEEEPKSRKTRLHVIASKLVSMAQHGDLQAIKEVVNRIDGPVPIPYQGSPNGTGLNSDGSPLVLVVKWGSPAAQPVDDIPMLELKAVGSTVASTAEPETKPSDTKDLA